MEYLKQTNDETAKRSKSKRIKKIHEQVKKVKASEQIAESLEEELGMVQSVYQTAQQYAPEYEEEKVLSAWMSKREILQTDRF